MIHAIVVAGILAASTVNARAEEAAAPVVDQLARFAMEGCSYLHQAFLHYERSHPRSRKVALHFGKVLSVQPKGAGEEFVLATPLFKSWSTTYFMRTVELQLPADVRLTVKDFEKRLGRAELPDADMAALPTAARNETRRPEPLALQFGFRPDHPGCMISVTTDGVAADRRDQRVTAFSFND
jgi:hypothetical protein